MVAAPMIHGARLSRGHEALVTAVASGIRTRAAGVMMAFTDLRAPLILCGGLHFLAAEVGSGTSQPHDPGKLNCNGHGGHIA